MINTPPPQNFDMNDPVFQRVSALFDIKTQNGQFAHAKNETRLWWLYRYHTTDRTNALLIHPSIHPYYNQSILLYSDLFSNDSKQI
jgi:hypothetical protein